MDIRENWKDVKSLFKESFKSSFHFAIATVSEGDEPLVTPIGALILGEPGHGFYFEKYSRHFSHNLESNKQVCVLAVNSGKWFWIKSLVSGKFTSPPAVRLHGVAGELREATDKEIALWQKRVQHVRFSKGHELLWSKSRMRMVREIEFTKIEPVYIGEMTSGSWSAQPNIKHA